MTVILACIIDQIQMDKFVASPGQCKWRLGFSHTKHILLLLPEPHGQSGKVAVTGYQTESVHLILVKQIHSINNHSHIRAVFAGCVGKLLNRRHRILQQNIFLPARLFGPVAVDPPAGSKSIFLQLVKNHLYISGADIFRIDQHRKLHLFFPFHHILHRFMPSGSRPLQWSLLRSATDPRSLPETYPDKGTVHPEIPVCPNLRSTHL